MGYRITGRIDDVIYVSGCRISNIEVEHALVGHPKVAEAAVVGYPHDEKGNGLFCCVTLKDGIKGDVALKEELVAEVRKNVGPSAQPDHIIFSALPKTRSGKIM